MIALDRMCNRFDDLARAEQFWLCALCAEVGGPALFYWNNRGRGQT